MRNFLNVVGFFKVSSRINRIQFLGVLIFWLLTGCLSLIALGWGISSQLFPLESISYAISWVSIISGFLVSIVVMLNIWFLIIRRLNDCGFNRWWSLLIIVSIILWPIIAIFLFLIPLCYPGEVGDNRFGKQPKTDGSFYYPMIVIIVVPAAAINLLFYFVLSFSQR